MSLAEMTRFVSSGDGKIWIQEIHPRFTKQRGLLSPPFPEFGIKYDFGSGMTLFQFKWHELSSWERKKKIMDSTISCQKSFLLLSFCFYCSLWIHFFKSKNPSLKAQYSIPKTHPLFRPWKPVPLTELAAKMAKPVDPDGHLSNGWRVGGWMDSAMEIPKMEMVRW